MARNAGASRSSTTARKSAAHPGRARHRLGVIRASSMKIRCRLGLAAILSSALLAACHSGGNSAPVADIWNLYSRPRLRRRQDPRRHGTPPRRLSRAGEGPPIHHSPKSKKAGWKIEKQEFDGDTPREASISATSSPAFGNDPATQQAIVCSHYDTKLFDTIRFLGRQRWRLQHRRSHRVRPRPRPRPALARRVELVFLRRRGKPSSTHGNRRPLRQPPLCRSAARQRPASSNSNSPSSGHDGPKPHHHPLPDSPPALNRRHPQGRRRPPPPPGLHLLREQHLRRSRPLDHIAEMPAIDLIDFNYPPLAHRRRHPRQTRPRKPPGRRRRNLVFILGSIPCRMNTPMNTITRTSLKELLEAASRPPHRRRPSRVLPRCPSPRCEKLLRLRGRIPRPGQPRRPG